LQSDISSVLNDSKTSQLAKDIINKSLLGTFYNAPDVAKNSIVSGINTSIQNNRGEVIQAVSLINALQQTSTNLSSIKNQNTTWNKIAGNINPAFSSNVQSMAYGQMAGVESLLLSNSIVQGNEYLSFILSNALANGIALDSRMIEDLKKSLLSVNSYNDIWKEERDKNIKQCTSALIDAIPGANSIKGAVEGISGKDLVTGDNISFTQRGFDIALALVDLKAFKSLTSIGKSSKTWGGRTIDELASLNIDDSAKTVLGSYVPNGGYIAKAQKMAANYFDIGDTWNLMSKEERWATNTRFLDIIAERGNQVYLSVSKQNIKPGTYLADEII